MAAALRITPKEYRAIAAKPVKRGRFPVSQKAGRTVDGRLFDSAKEAHRYAELRLMRLAGEIDDLECQVPYEVEIIGKHYCTFTVDFQFFDNRLRCRVREEVKSSGTKRDAAYRLRRKAVELHYGFKITEVIR